MYLFKDYPFLVLLSSLIYFVLFVYSFRIRTRPGGVFLRFAVGLLCLDGFFAICELRAEGLETKLFWRNVQQIPLYTTPVMLLGIIMSAVGIRRRVIVRTVAGLLGVMVVYWILLFTDPYHHLIRREVWVEPFGDFERIGMSRTYFGLLFFNLNLLIGMAGFGILLFHARQMVGRHRTQLVLLMLAALCPYAMFKLSDVFDVEMNVATATLPTAVLLFASLHSYKLLRVRPLAREKVLEHMSEGILIADEHNQVIDANPAARRIEGLGRKGKTVGANLADLFGDRPELMALIREERQGKVEMVLGDKHLEIRYIPIARRGRKDGALLIFTDITERKTYETELLRQATIDALTDVYNRKMFFGLLEELRNGWQASLRDAEEGREDGKAPAPPCLMLMDVDHFKQINDRYGHVVGDRVLRHFSSLLKEFAGNLGGVGRIGGEEFGVCFSSMEEEDARDLAERLRQRLMEKTIRLDDPGHPGQDIFYTVSVGIAELKSGDRSVEDWYQRADRCMYVSKQEDRNRSTMAKQLAL